MRSTVVPKNTWVQKLWPVKRCELKKVIPLLLLKFLVSFVYSLLTCMKDTLVVTTAHAGAEVIPVLKGSIVFPLSIVAALVYAKLTNHVKRNTLFYGIITFFLLIILLYGFFLYPNVDAFSPHASADWLMARLGPQYAHWIAVYRHWMHALFFVTAEIWGQLVIFILYWGFVNHICQIEEAKRIYTLLIAAGDVAPLMTGGIVFLYVKKYALMGFTLVLQTLVVYIVVAGLLIMATYWWMQRCVLTSRQDAPAASTPAPIHPKPKLSLIQSLKQIGSSRYLRNIAVLTVGCALTINMIEVTWKAYLKTCYPAPADYQVFMGKLTFATGLTALLTVLFLSGNLLRRFGWHVSAQISPMAIGVTGVLFFLMSYCSNYLGPLAHYMGVTPLMFLVLFGAFQNILSKAVKYSFFDATREIAYIPLDQESKVKGKAAVDLIGSRLGKAGSSWLQILLIELCGTGGSVLSITPLLMLITCAATAYWSYSAYHIQKVLCTKEQAGQSAR